jgi:hypothetical protein
MVDARVERHGSVPPLAWMPSSERKQVRKHAREQRLVVLRELSGMADEKLWLGCTLGQAAGHRGRVLGTHFAVVRNKDDAALDNVGLGPGRVTLGHAADSVVLGVHIVCFVVGIRVFGDQIALEWPL